MRALAIGLFALTGVLVVGLLGFGALGTWFNDARWGGLAMLCLVGCFIFGATGGVLLSYASEKERK